MPKTAKHHEYFLKMLELNKEKFDDFKKIHELYSENPEKYQAEFNEAGRDIQDIIRDWEDRLCSHSENGQYGKFSSNLSDKFWTDIRTLFPKIDYIGLS